jgi:urease accessory protein
MYLMSTGGSIVQADRLRMDFDFGADTFVYVTTQAATKVHRMDAGYATRMVNLRVGPRAYVEHLPEPVIPFGGALLPTDRRDRGPDGDGAARRDGARRPAPLR